MGALVSFVMAHGLEILGGIMLILSGALAIALAIPGDTPDTQLQAIIDFLKKLSVK